jgi:hypothetical protein
MMPALRQGGLALCLGLVACTGSQDSAQAQPPGFIEFAIEAPELTESSGLAGSQREPGVYWSHNDSGGPATAYAFDESGALRGTLSLTGALNLDWEDMASFVENGQPRLLLADVGDNLAARPLLAIYIADEPALPAGNVPDLRQLPRRTLRFAYPDGPRDCESVAVDAQEGFIYLLSKRDAVPRLYRLPLNSLLPLTIAEALGEIAIPRAPAGTPEPTRIDWVNGMDFDPSGTRLAMVTLTQAHLYTRAAGESWAAALQRMPRSIDLPDYPQIEAVTWTADGSALLVSSEGNPTLVARIPLTP